MQVKPALSSCSLSTHDWWLVVSDERWLSDHLPLSTDHYRLFHHTIAPTTNTASGIRTTLMPKTWTDIKRLGINCRVSKGLGRIVICDSCSASQLTLFKNKSRLPGWRDKAF